MQIVRRTSQWPTSTSTFFLVSPADAPTLTSSPATLRTGSPRHSVWPYPHCGMTPTSFSTKSQSWSSWYLQMVSGKLVVAMKLPLLQQGVLTVTWPPLTVSMSAIPLTGPSGGQWLTVGMWERMCVSVRKLWWRHMRSPLWMILSALRRGNSVSVVIHGHVLVL